jgi:hypothetical protein
MDFRVSTYRTFSGIKEIVEICEKKPTQWLIYENNKPKFFVDFFNLEIESNVMMNSLVLCGKKSIEEVLEHLNKRNNIHLSIPIITKLRIKKRIKTEIKELHFPPLPEEWLSYSL